jgi:hypothetical protein
MSPRNITHWLDTLPKPSTTFGDDDVQLFWDARQCIRAFAFTPSYVEYIIQLQV